MSIAALYSRKSKFTGKGESIENQVQLCKSYAEGLGVTDFLIYEDEGFSGKDTDRPEFQRMMADAKAKKFDMLICYRLDRVSRNIGDFSALIDELQALGISFVSIREQFDTSTPMGRAMMFIASVFAQLERETIAERVRDNMLELAKSGRWLGGQTPMGFESEPIIFLDAEMKERKMFRLSPVPEELEVIKVIFNKYYELQSVSQVLKYLLSMHYKTKTGCDWNKKQILQVLNNTVYVKATLEVAEYLKDQGITVVGNIDGKHGLLTYNKKQGKAIYRDTDEWIAAVARHEGIIEADRWLYIQATLKENKAKAPRLGKTNTALLSGLIRCAHCNSTMRVTYTGSKKADGSKVYYYSCTMKNASGGTRCTNKNVNGPELEKVVIDKLKENTTDMGFLISELEEYKKEAAAAINDTSMTDKLKAEIKKTEDSISSLVAQLRENPTSAAAKYIITEIEKLNDNLEAKKAELLAWKTSNNSIEDINIDILLQTAKNFNRQIDTADIEEKRMLIASMVDTIYWDGSTGDVEIRLWGMGKRK